MTAKEATGEIAYGLIFDEFVLSVLMLMVSQGIMPNVSRIIASLVLC
jgi:hypothetical protein